MNKLYISEAALNGIKGTTKIKKIETEEYKKEMEKAEIKIEEDRYKQSQVIKRLKREYKK